MASSYGFQNEQGTISIVKQDISNDESEDYLDFRVRIPVASEAQIQAIGTILSCCNNSRLLPSDVKTEDVFLSNFEKVSSNLCVCGLFKYPDASDEVKRHQNLRCRSIRTPGSEPGGQGGSKDSCEVFNPKQTVVMIDDLYDVITVNVHESFIPVNEHGFVTGSFRCQSKNGMHLQTKLSNFELRGDSFVEGSDFVSEIGQRVFDIVKKGEQFKLFREYGLDEDLVVRVSKSEENWDA